MKKLLLTTLVTAMSITAAHAAPKVYGQLDVSIDSIKDDKNTDNVIKVQSNASRFGLKGEDELTPTISAVYQAEFGVSGDGTVTTTPITTTGTDSTGKAITATSTASETGGLEITQRNRFVGLKHVDFGTLKVGKYDSYTKLAQAKVDLFNDRAGETLDMKNTFAGENRLSNVIGYETKKYDNLGGLQFNIMLQPGEQTKSQTFPASSSCVATPADVAAGKTTCEDNSIANAISTSITLDNADKGYYAALAADSKVISTFPAVGVNSGKAKANIIRLVGSAYMPQLAGVTLNALYQSAKPSEDATATGSLKKEDAYLVGASYKITPEISVGAQYQASSTELVGATEKRDINQFGIVAEYGFSEKTKAGLYYADRKVNKNPTAASTSADFYDISYKVAGVSLLHKF